MVDLIVPCSPYCFGMFCVAKLIILVVCLCRLLHCGHIEESNRRWNVVIAKASCCDGRTTGNYLPNTSAHYVERLGFRWCCCDDLASTLFAGSGSTRPVMYLQKCTPRHDWFPYMPAMNELVASMEGWIVANTVLIINEEATVEP